MSSAKFSPLLDQDEEGNTYSTPFRHIQGTAEFSKLTSSSCQVEPLEIGDGMVDKTLHATPPSVNRRRRLVKLVAGICAIVVSLTVSYHMGENKGMDEVYDEMEEEIDSLTASLGDDVQDFDNNNVESNADDFYAQDDTQNNEGVFDDDDTEDTATQDDNFGNDDTSTKGILEDELDYYDTHPDQKRPFSLMLLKHKDYKILYDDAFRNQDFGDEVQDFLFYYETEKDLAISVTLAWFNNMAESYDDIYATRMHYAEDKINDVPILGGDFTGTALLRDIKAEYPTTNILFRERGNTWEFSCEVIKAEDCIELAKTNLVRVTESEFVDTIEEVGY